MELRHLRYFVTIAQEQSFTKAAQKLFIAQPSLSQQMKDLEAEVGVSLLDRSARQIRLTEEGQAFLKHAHAALDSAALAIASARQVAQQKTQQLHIGFLNVAEIKVMPLILAKLKQQMPNVHIHIQSASCLAQIQALKAAKLDIAFTRYALEHSDYCNHLLFKEAVYLVVSKKYYARRCIARSQLREQHLIMCEQSASPVFYEKIQQCFAFQDLNHAQLLWVTNVLQHINLINLGLGFSFLPAYALKFLSDDVHLVETDFVLPELALYANYRRETQSAALQLIVEELRSYTP